MGMFDEIRVEGFSLPGVSDEALNRAQTREIRLDLGEPDTDIAGHEFAFQTKDLENCLQKFVIARSGDGAGRLLLRRYLYEEVPEGQRPYYGTPEWEHGTLGHKEWIREQTGRKPYPGSHTARFFRELGSRRVAGYTDADTGFHGDVVFYAAAKKLGLSATGPEDCTDNGPDGFDLVEFRARFTDGELAWIRRQDEARAGAGMALG